MAFRFRRCAEFRDKVNGVVAGLPNRDAIHLSAIDFSHGLPDYAGVNDEKPVYPASLYKLSVAGALLQEIAAQRVGFSQMLTVKPHNAVDKTPEIASDQRPLLQAGDRLPVGYALDFMVTGSSNTCANELIDLVGRKTINQFLAMHNWDGNEVTRKFLPRDVEDEDYKKAPPTTQSTRHFAELLYLWKLGSLPHSGLMRTLLLRQLDNTKISRGLPPGTPFAHKTGWYSFVKDDKRVGVSGDVGIVEAERKGYVVACVVVVPDEEGNELLGEIGRRLHAAI